MNILVFNAGSSSLKYGVFKVRGKKLIEIFRGHFDNHGKAINNFEFVIKKAVTELMRKKIIKNLKEVSAVGHRVVHGGSEYTQPTKITPRVIATMKKLSRLAPLHNPPNLACILACKKLFSGVMQVAVFDTAFHHTMSEKVFLYGLPYALSKKFGIRRYGFHGISHQYVFEEAQKKLGRTRTRRTVTCHLGNGCSITAILDGKVVDTSMGFAPLEGIPMGTRSGDIDPAIIFYLLEKGYTADEIEHILTKESGLKGVSEISSDMRDIWAKYQKKDRRSVRVMNWFAYRIAKYIGAYATALGGLDCLVFTGGMGEKAWYLRKIILSYLKIFPKKKVLVLKTDEEKKIAQETETLL